MDFRIIGLFIAALSSSLLTACGTYQMGATKDLSPSEVAVLTMSFPRLLPQVFVTHIDCESPGFTSPKSFQLLPGWRAVTLQGNADLGMAPDPKTYVLRVETGRSYTYYPDPNNPTNTWFLVFVDDATNQRIEAAAFPADMNLLTGASPRPGSCEMVADLNRTGAVELPGGSNP